MKLAVPCSAANVIGGQPDVAKKPGGLSGPMAARSGLKPL
jgi:hypothetical protein